MREMNKDRTSLHFLVLIYTLSIANQSFATDQDLPPEASPEIFFWVALVSLGFVWGALNGLCLLVLRHVRYQEAGYRWTNAFWLGVLWGPLTFLLTRVLFRWWGQWSWEDLEGSTVSLLFLTLITLNLGGVWLLGIWASRE